MSERIHSPGDYKEEGILLPISSKTFSPTELLSKTEQYVKNYLESNLPEKYKLHSYNQTIEIVKACRAICDDSGIDQKDCIKVQLAAWFINTGYCVNPQNPLQSSAEIAGKFLTGKMDNESIREIKSCILSSYSKQRPALFIARVLCDAVSFQLADSNYPNYLELLRKEWIATRKKKYSYRGWLKKHAALLDEHTHFTDSAKRMFAQGKRKNKKRLQRLLEQHDRLLPDGESTEGKMDIIFEDKIKLERGVETLFRVTSRRHTELSTMAHNKASLLITINALIISVILSVLSTKLQTNRQLILPTVLLIMTSVSTIVIAFISTRPILLGTKKTPSTLEANESNILFFGHFLKMSMDEYKKAIRDTIVDKEKIYDSLSRDIYYQGLVLVEKYRYITIAYYVFIIGLVVSTLAFMLTFIFFNPAP
jgi:predicted metal-dependent HD superfamily phosphohydrolase